MPPIHRSDIKPLEFIVAVFVGSLGSVLLSWLSLPAYISVVFAVTIMIVLAVLRWRIASEFKDHQSLEAFAEDIYLLGYLLTLAALLGLTPRLMSDQTNLFRLAGLKLVTTVLGLALMMIFRQTARRWAEEREGEEASVFLEQQRLFSEAVTRLNHGADQLTAKLDEVVSRFDPSLLEPLAEWSNRAAGTFSNAARMFETVPVAVEKGLHGLKAVNDELAQVGTGVAELSAILRAGVAEAANTFAAELQGASRAANLMANSVTQIQSASLSAQAAIETLGFHATAGSTELNELNGNFRRGAAEVGKVERALTGISQTGC